MKVPNAEIVFLFAGSCIAIVQNLADCSTVLLTSPLTCCCSAGCSATRPAPSTAGATPSWSRGQCNNNNSNNDINSNITTVARSVCQLSAEDTVSAGPGAVATLRGADFYQRGPCLERECYDTRV